MRTAATGDMRDSAHAHPTHARLTYASAHTQISK